jgi:hypothetical protein
MKYSQNAVPNKPRETGKVAMQTNKEPDIYPNGLRLRGVHWMCSFWSPIEGGVILRSMGFFYGGNVAFW